MHLVAAMGNVGVVKILCADNPGIRNEGNGDDEDGDTALHIATSMNRLEAFKAILSHFSGSAVKAIDAENNMNQTPLYQACYWDHADVVQLLLDKGADYNNHCCDGWTPLHAAAVWGQAERRQVAPR